MKKKTKTALVNPGWVSYRVRFIDSAPPIAPEKPIESLYLIGSLRNRKIPLLGDEIRKLGIEVFDAWQCPGPHADDFWRQYEKGRGHSYKEALSGAAAQNVFYFDKTNLDKRQAAVLVMPAGKSAHLELGYMRGCGKRAYILFDGEPKRWDVMYNFATAVFTSKKDLLEELKRSHDSH
jgi:hypothetical protein